MSKDKIKLRVVIDYEYDEGDFLIESNSDKYHAKEIMKSAIKAGNIDLDHITNIDVKINEDEEIKKFFEVLKNIKGDIK